MSLANPLTHPSLLVFVRRETEEAIAKGIDPATLVYKPTVPQPVAAQKAEPKQTKVVASVAKAPLVNPVAKLATTPPTEAPAKLDFAIRHPTSVNAVSVDIIKLAAQFTAVNGRDFLSALVQREQRNPHFDFLKPTHMLFSYFTTLVDSYSKILHPSPEQKQRMQEHLLSDKVLEHGVQRWAWARAEEERKNQESTQADEERQAFQAIDWYDFTVVEVIDFREDELLDLNLPGLSVSGQVDGKNNGAGISPPAGGAKAMPGIPPPPPPPPLIPPVHTMPSASQEATSLSSSARSFVPPPQPPPPPGAQPLSASSSSASAAMVVDEGDEEEAGLKVVTDYQPRIQSNTARPLQVIDPVTGLSLAPEKVEEHMRIQLLDPRWREEQRRFQEKQKETGYAEGSSIADSLKVFARKRGDIFGQSLGQGEGSAQAIAQLEHEEQKRSEEQSRVQWDGSHTTVMSTQRLKDEMAANISTVSTSAASASASSAPVIGPAAAPPPPQLTLPGSFGKGMAAPPPAPRPVPVPLSIHPVPPPHVAPVPILPTLPVIPMSYSMPPPPPPMPTLPPFAGAAVPTMPPGFVPPAAVPGPSTDMDEENKAKRPRVVPDLLSAEDFAAAHPEPVSFTVAMPNEPAFNFSGQSVELTLSILATIKDVKEAVLQQLGSSLGVGKLQIKHSAQGFLKDQSSLAAVNLTSGSALEASIKSRGGKR